MSISAIQTSVPLALAATTSSANSPQARLIHSLQGPSAGGDQDIGGENDHDADDFSAKAAASGAGNVTPFRGNKVNTTA